MSDLYIETRLQAIKDIASASCVDIKDADNIASFCDEIYSAIPNLDKIVEELQEFLINYGVSEKSNVHQRIIEIVKAGGVSIDELSKYAEIQYNKAIDDFAKRLIEELSHTTLVKDGYYLANIIKPLAEQLKAGGNDEMEK